MRLMFRTDASLPMALQILTPAQAQAKLRRMALQVLERHYAADQLVLWGIGIRGPLVARALASALAEAGAPPVLIIDLAPGNTAPEAPPDAPWILVDDVLYSGRTALDAVAALAHRPWPSLELAVLVDRGHQRVPLSATYVGLRLATTLQAFVRVEHGPDGFTAWLE